MIFNIACHEDLLTNPYQTVNKFWKFISPAEQFPVGAANPSVWQNFPGSHDVGALDPSGQYWPATHWPPSGEDGVEDDAFELQYQPVM